MPREAKNLVKKMSDKGKKGRKKKNKNKSAKIIIAVTISCELCYKCEIDARRQKRPGTIASIDPTIHIHPYINLVAKSHLLAIRPFI